MILFFFPIDDLQPTDKMKSVQDIIIETGVTTEALSNPFSDEVLLKLSTLCDKWQHIGIHLGLSSSDIEKIAREFRTTDERMVRILEYWRTRDESKATYKKLIEVLFKSKETKLAMDVCKAVKAASSGLYLTTIMLKLSVTWYQAKGISDFSCKCCLNCIEFNINEP